MGDFFQRLAELALGTPPLVTPLATTMFGPAPWVSGAAPEPGSQAAIDDEHAASDPAASPEPLRFEGIVSHGSAPFGSSGQQAAASSVEPQEDARFGAPSTPDFALDAAASPSPAPTVGIDRPLHREAGLPSVGATSFPEPLLKPGTAQVAASIPALHEMSAALAAFGENALPARPQRLAGRPDLTRSRRGGMTRSGKSARTVCHR